MGLHKAFVLSVHNRVVGECHQSFTTAPKMRACVHFLAIGPKRRTANSFGLDLKCFYCPLGIVKFFKVPFGKLISRVFCSNSLATPLIFPLASIWRLKAASNLEAVKLTLLNKSCSNQKILADLLLKLLKLIKPIRGDFFEQLLFNKVDFGASDFEAAVGLQI